jgi:enediyne biosynthesis protein E4
MTNQDTALPVKPLLVLIAGVVVGALTTTALVLGITELVRGDSSPAALGAPAFIDESVGDGIDQVYTGEFQYYVGGGVAVFDCNDDLLPDLYFAGGANAAALYVNRSDQAGPLQFEHSRVTDVDLTNVTGAYPLDVDSDGIIDIAVLRVGQNVMLRGLGDCQFERANEQWNVDGGGDWTVAFSATWEDGQTLPTLAFGNYLALSESNRRDECADHVLMRPEADRYQAPISLSPGWCTLSILFSDWSRSGERGLRMTNDRHYYRDGQEQMWRVVPGSAPRLYTGEDGWETMKIWGMGIASHDVTGDGLPELFLTSQGDNKLQTLAYGAERPTYEDMALSVGATSHRPFTGSDMNRPSTAWHAEFGDVNNDGFIDLFVTKGNVEAQDEFAMDDPNNLLLGQNDGTFREGAGDAGLADPARSRGGALADLNLDGLLDVVVVERREPVRVWRNSGEAYRWLQVELRQNPPNRDAIGAWVEVRTSGVTVSSEVTIGGGHASGELGALHFGLGDADVAELRVIWPDGEQGAWMKVEADRVVRVDRDVATVSTVWAPRD